tara:strand:+ start:292 stop:1479 length:1188 start_codon:yes stop_codon:yes gene_type:complete
MVNKILKKCCVCDSKNLEQILDLPSLPLTGLYFPNIELAMNSELYDQGLNRCKDCGHAQLKTAIDPHKVYDATYTHRSSESSISKGGNDFLYKYIKDNYKINHETKLLEVGCNDGYLLEKISKSSFSACGIDPIWINKESPISNSYKIFGGYAIDIRKLIPQKLKPNFIVSAHTFEHTVSLFEELKCIVDFAEDNANFIIEMPSFDTLIRLRRFDQIFHQHIQYINESSISKLVERLNCNLKDISYNFNYWGGTVIFSFCKSAPKNSNKELANLDNESIKKSLDDFNSYKKILGRQLSFHKEVYYLGAAQMLPILHYHLKSEINNLAGILDDNNQRIGKFLPSIDKKIRSLSNLNKKEIASSGKLIGAVDSAKALIKRSKEIGLFNIYSLYQNLI